MKKKLLILILVLSNMSAFSQLSTDYNYSIAVKGLSLMQLPKVMNETDYDKGVTTYLNGLMLKFNDNQISYRISGSYLKKSKTFFNNCETCDEIKGEVKDFIFKVGFEKNFNFSRIQPYFGLDLGYRFNKFEGISQNINTLKADLGSIPGSKIEASKSGFIVSPVLGIKINPIKELSIFAEGNLDFFYAYERQEAVTQDAGNSRTLNKTNKSEFLLNPISVGIVFYFGSNQ